MGSAKTSFKVPREGTLKYKHEHSMMNQINCTLINTAQLMAVAVHTYQIHSPVKFMNLFIVCIFLKIVFDPLLSPQLSKFQLANTHPLQCFHW